MSSAVETSAAASGWTTRRLLAWLGDALARKDVDDARLCAELLVAHVIGCDRMRLYLDADRPARPEELDRLRGLARRALEHEPVQYLLGEAWFFGRPFAVDARVLIPRASTETLVEELVQCLRREGRTSDALAIADVGTGSGCIAITLAAALPAARLLATDLSAAALAVAAENAARHGVADRVELRAGDLLAALTSGRASGRASGAADKGAGTSVAAGPLDALVSNPPYIPDAEWHGEGLVGRNVKGQEPTEALRGGADGLAFVRPLLAGGPDHLAPGGHLLVEIAAATADEALAIARAQPLLTDARLLDDLDGLPRVVAARRR